MAFCIEYRKEFEWKDHVQSFVIDYKPNKSRELKYFLDTEGKGHKINIRFKEFDRNGLRFLSNLVKENEEYNLILRWGEYHSFDLFVSIVKEVAPNLPFYWEKPVNYFDEFIGVRALGAKEIFISGDLGFCLKDLKSKYPEISLRAYVNYAQPICDMEGVDKFKSFYIRPEDIFTYEKYIDTFEFYNSINKQNVLYDIYVFDGEWDGKLKDIIQNLDDEVNNYYLLGSQFGEERTNCHHKCLWSNRCHLCDKLKEFANTLNETEDYEVVKKEER